MTKEYEKLKTFYKNFKKNLLNKGFIISEPVYHDYHFVANLSKSDIFLEDKKGNIGIKIFYKPSTNTFRLLMNKDYDFKSLIIETFFLTEEKTKQLINSKNNLKDNNNINFNNNFNEKIKNNDLLEDKIEVFIDGSYNLKTDIVGWAFCIVKNYDVIYKEYGNLKDEYKNLRQIMGEIYALYKSITYLKTQNIKEAFVYYDYKGIECWINGEWKVKDKNIERLINQIKEILNENKIKVIFKKVEAHSGNYFNELVDKMAKESAKNND